MPILAIALLSLSLPKVASAQSLVVGNCIASTTSFDDTETVCVSGTTAGNSNSDPALVCVLPPTGGVANDDVTPDGCNVFAPATTMVDEPVWLPPTVPGSYIVVLFASDETVHQQFVFISGTAANDAPTATAQSVSTAEDVTLPITLSGTDPESDPLTFAVVTGPSNGSLSGVAPNLTYTPNGNFNGSDSFTFTVSDAEFTSLAATISITVTPDNDAPTASAQSLSTVEEVPIPITLTGTDPESDPLTFAVLSVPSNGTLSGVAPNLTYTPNANYNGADSFTFTASDASLTSAAATISITVTPGNDTPTATAQSVSTAEDVALPITLSGTDPESDPLTFTVVSGPSNGTLSGIAPNLTYTPNANYNGADSFTFTTSDASLTSAVATISITVTPDNDAPTATAQSVSTAEDVALPITLTGTDPESDPLTFTVVSGPSNGTLSGVAPNLTYTPNLDFNGSDSFTFTASDASLTSAAATISITVTPGNDTPTATAQSVSTAEDVALPITLSGTDPESDPLTFTVITGPGNGTLSGTAPNLIYTPNANFNGSDSFTFTASDASLTSAAATISITVTPGNDAPTATAQFVSTAEDVALPITLTGTDPESDPLTFTVVSGPSNGTLSGVAPNLTYTPNANFNGSDSFTFTVSDAEFTSLAATISITVTPDNDAPTASAQSLSTVEEVPIPITLTGTDPESDPLTFAVLSAPSNGTLSGVAPNLTYTPNANFSGADSFTFTVSDAEFTSPAATISITVTPGNDAPTASAQSLSTVEEVPIPITLTGTDPESDPLTFAVVTGPSNGTLSGTAPNLTYTPNLNFNGSDSFTFTASDASLTSAAATISITVTPGNDAPTASAQSLSTVEEVPIPIMLTGTDPESDPLTFTVVSVPSNGTLSGVAPNLTYTPNANYNGADSFTFTASDASLTSAAATISITVTPGNDAPTATAVSISGVPALGEVLIGLYTYNDADGDLEGMSTYAWRRDGVPIAMTLSYTVLPADQGATLVFEVTPIAATGENPGLAVASTGVAIMANAAPTATNVNVAGLPEAGQDLLGEYSYSDIDGDLEGVSTFRWLRDGSPITGATASTYKVVETDKDASLQFEVTPVAVSGASPGVPVSSTAVVIGNVVPMITGQQTVSTPEDAGLLMTLDMLTVLDLDNIYPTDFTLAVHDGVNYTRVGNTITPRLDFNGDLNVPVSVNDGDSESAIFNAVVEVTALNDKPEITGQVTLSTLEDASLTVLVTDLTLFDPDNIFPDDFVLLLQDGVNYTRVDNTITPDPNFNGVLTVLATVTDGSGEINATSDPFSLAISVGAENDEPVVDTLIDSQVAIEGTEFNLDVSRNFSDADNDLLAYTAVGLPASGNLGFDPATGVFSGTPRVEDARDNDPYIIVVTASDGQPGSIPAQTEFELNITALDRANVLLDISVAPDPAMLNDELLWTLTASNTDGPRAATNIELTGSFVGSGLSISSTSSCTIQAAVGQVSDFGCFMGDLSVGQSMTVEFITTTSTPSDVVIFASALSTDAVPIDPIIADNSRQISVGVAESFSLGAVQVLGNAEVRSIAAGDIDGDGVVDLVVGTAAGQPVQTYLSGGFRDFVATAISLPDNSANEGIAVADFDKNGTLDLVVANGRGAADIVYSNDGVGNFTVMTTLGFSDAEDIAIGDFDNDGNLDIVIATTQGNPVYLGDGIGGFALHATLGNAYSHSVAVARLNSDALDDIVFANTGSDSQVWIKNAGAGFIQGDSLAIGDAAAVAVGEFGGDLRPDLAFGRVSSGVGDLPANPVLINDGTGRFGGPLAELGMSSTNDIHAADVNRDGLSDLVFINSNSVHQIWTATGSGFNLHREQIVDVDSTVGVLTELGMTDVGDAGGVDLAMGGADLSGLGIFLNDGFGNLGFGDAVPPVLTLLGQTTVSVQSGNTYSDAGATAQDNIDGDISRSVVATGTVNTMQEGTYVITYNVVDRAGNDATPITRTITVIAAVATGGGSSGGNGGGGGGAVSLLVLLLLTIGARRNEIRRFSESSSILRAR